MNLSCNEVMKLKGKTLRDRRGDTWRVVSVTDNYIRLQGVTGIGSIRMITQIFYETDQHKYEIVEQEAT